MRTLVATAAYLGALLAGVAAFNAGDTWTEIGYTVWFAASFGLGIYTGRPWFFLVPLAVALPLAIPFDYAESSSGSDGTWVSLIAVLTAVPSAAPVLFGVWVRSDPRPQASRGHRGSGRAR